MLTKVRVGWAVGLVGVAITGAAQAQEVQSSAEAAHHEAVLLSLQGSLVDYQKTTVTPDTPEGSSVQPAEQKTSSTGFGPLGAGLGFGIGYAWDQVVFGARANFTKVDTTAPSGRDSSGTNVSVLPRLELMFNRDTTRPYIAGIVGIEHTSATTSISDVNSGTSATSIDDSTTLYAIGGAFGVHGFLNRSVSLDPEFTLLYASGSGTVKSPSGFDSDPVSQGYSVSGVRALFSVSLTGWIDTGGAPTPPPPTSEGTEAPATVAATAPVASDEPEAKPVSADVHLPNHRRLYLQVSKDPARPSVLVRLTEQRGDDALAKCDDVAIMTNGGPLKLAVRSHGENYLTGRLPLGGLEVLVASPNASISVCAEQWELSDTSREAVQGFLSARHDLLVQTGETEAAAAPVAAPAPTPDAPADPNAVPPAAPTGTFPPPAESAPPAPLATDKAAPAAPGAPKAAKPKK